MRSLVPGSWRRDVNELVAVAGYDRWMEKVDKSSRGAITGVLVFVAAWMGIPFPCSRENDLVH
jgi:hypothetical protein